MQPIDGLSDFLEGGKERPESRLELPLLVHISELDPVWFQYH